MKLAWLTDIHLNFLDVLAREHFYHDIIHKHPAAVLISGDIAEAPSLIELLEEMAQQVDKPIYFVLGNHDYYHGNVADIREKITALTEKENLLFWLPALGAQLLQPGTILVGQDGWADGRLGNYQASPVVLNDSRLIADLAKPAILGKNSLLEKMQELADNDALQLQHNLLAAIKQYHPKKIIILMHVPPFKEVCLYEGKISSDDYLPFYSSKATGDILIAITQQYLAIEFLVLCGHTHGAASVNVLKNLTIKVGHAEYAEPRVEAVITV